MATSYGLVGLLCFALMAPAATATQFRVGGDKGWSVPDGTTEPYNTWAGRMRFQIGDQLLFVYPKETDSVLLVDQAAYNACNTTTYLTKFEGGSTVFTLDRSGPFFFISGNQASCTAHRRRPRRRPHPAGPLADSPRHAAHVCGAPAEPSIHGAAVSPFHGAALCRAGAEPLIASVHAAAVRCADAEPDVASLWCSYAPHGAAVRCADAEPDVSSLWCSYAHPGIRTIPDRFSSGRCSRCNSRIIAGNSRLTAFVFPWYPWRRAAATVRLHQPTRCRRGELDYAGQRSCSPDRRPNQHPGSRLWVRHAGYLSALSCKKKTFLSRRSPRRRGGGRDGAPARCSFSSHSSSPSTVPSVRLRRASSSLVVSASAFLFPSLDAVICDYDGVLLESEHLHRKDYNDAFVHFGTVGAATEGTWPARGGAAAAFGRGRRGERRRRRSDVAGEG